MTPTPDQVLATPMGPNDSGADTVRGYLVALLAEVWRERDNFSGKRPFGNSDWDWDLMVPLVRAGYIRGEIDGDGYLNDCDFDEGRRLVFDAIGHLGAAQPPTSAASIKDPRPPIKGGPYDAEVPRGEG